MPVRLRHSARDEHDTYAKCCRCRKRLLWKPPGATPKPRKLLLKGRRVWVRARSNIWANRGRLAIRCSDCLYVFCPRCARKHFAPVLQATGKIERAIERAALKAIRAHGIACSGVDSRLSRKEPR